jgi:hypothetical protein
MTVTIQLHYQNRTDLKYIKQVRLFIFYQDQSNLLVDNLELDFFRAKNMIKRLHLTINSRIIEPNSLTTIFS